LKLILKPENQSQLTTTWVLEDPNIYCHNPPIGHRKWHALKQQSTIPKHIRSKAAYIEYNLFNVSTAPKKKCDSSRENDIINSDLSNKENN
jgi:hypothetical protein